MANLLNWSGGISIRKKEDENTQVPLINSLRTLNPTPAKTNSFRPIDAASLRNNISANSSGVTNAFARAQQINDQMRQQAEQRRQEEERQRQEQEQRRQQEEARRAQEQQERQQKQQQLLDSIRKPQQQINGQIRQRAEQRQNSTLEALRRSQQQVNNINNQIQQRQEQSGNGWKKYYDEEKQKVRDQVSLGERIGQDMFNSGWDQRLAEVNARNRYARDVRSRAYDDNGNILDAEAAKNAKKITAENMNVANQYGEQERAVGRAIGATADSDYKDNQFLATLNAIRRMDVGNAVLNGAEGDGADAGKFLVNLLPGMFSAPITGVTNAAESLAGKGLDQSTGRFRELTPQERLGRVGSGAIDLVGPFIGGTGSFLKSTGNAILKKGSSEVAKQALKNTTTSALKDYLKSMLVEGSEEGVQQALEFFGNGGRLVTKDGEFDADSFKKMMEESGQAAALGAVGGGIFQAGSRVINAATNRKANNSVDINSNINNRLIGNNATNVSQNTEVNATNVANSGIDASQIRKTDDGQLVKQDANGTTTRLSDVELANTIDQNNNIQQNTTNNLNSFQNNALNLRSSTDDVNTMSRRASQGDTYAQQRLAELTNQNQEENTDWRGKSVDETINPERAELAKTLEMLRGTDIDVNPEATKRGLGETNARALEELNSKILDDANYPSKRSELIEAIAENPALYDYLYSQGAINDTNYFGPNLNDTETVNINKLTDAQRQKLVEILRNGGYDTENNVKFVNENEVAPNQASLLDQIRVVPEEELANTPEVLPSERDIAERPATVAISPENLSQEPVAPTRTDTVGTGEGTTETSTRIPTEEELSVRTPEQQAYDAQMPRGEVDSVAELMNTPSGKSSFVTVLKGVSNRVRDVVKNAIGIDVSGYNHTMDSSSVRHALNKHSNDAIPLEVKDLDLVPDIIKNADTVEYSRKNGRNLDTIVYTKQYGNKVAYVEEIRNGRHQLAMNTMYWVGKGQQKSTPTGEFSDNSTNSGRALPRPAGSAYDGIVAQNGENVNANSSFAANTSANNNFSEETRRALKNDPISYTPTTNEERLARANEILSTKTPDEVDTYLRDNFFNVKAKNASSEDMVLAGEFAKMLDARGQYDRSTEIINKMSEIGTKQGQNIQAMSIMMNRSPEGIANMAQNAVKKGGGEMNGEVRRQIVEKTQEIGKTRGERARLSERNDTISQQIMNGEGDLKALRKEQMQIAQTYRQNLDQEGRQFAQLTEVVNKNSPDNRSIFGSVWRAGLLSGPRTHTGNALSNTFQNILNAGTDRIASGLDWARAKITGTEREVVGSDRGLRARSKGLKRGLSAAKEVLKTGDNLWEGTDIVTGKTTAWGQGGELEFKNKIANNMVAKPTNYVFRAMSAGDLPFRYAAFENAIRTEAKRQGINQGYKGQALQDYINSRVATPDPELQAYGIRKGNESVYDIDTKLSDVMNRVDKFIDGQENKLVKNGLKGVKTLVAPFVKVPSKVLSTAIDYSPLGSVKAIVNKVGSKGYTTAQFETDLAKSGLGTAGFVGLGYALSAAGLLTGGYPDSADERNRWKAEGIEPNSIKIGDTYLSLNYLGPASMLMAMGSGVQQRQARGEDALSIAQGTVMDTLNTFLDQSYVQGLSNALNAITDSNRYGESYVNSFARGLVPNLLRQTATATDPMQRQVNNAGEAVVSGIPGASQNLDAKVDTYGREIGNKQTLPLGQMWDALKLSNSRETNDVITEVNRLHNVDPNNKDLQITPPKEDNTLSVNGQNVKITDSQKTQLQKDVGNAAITAMRQVMQSEKYAGLSDQEKAKALDKARSDAQTEARKKFIEANNITASNNPGTKNSGGSMTGNYVSKAIGKAASNTKGKSTITISDSLAKDYSDILDKYNSMSSDDWNEYIYGNTAEAAAAEYKLAKAKYENDLANGKLTEVKKVKRQKELDKLGVSQEWTKDYRDAYSLAGSKTDMQEFLDTMDDETRAKTVAVLNGLNNAMLEAGIIKASTYKTRHNAINNTSSSKSKGGRKKSGSGSDGISSAEASAMSSLAKTMVKNTNKGTTNTSKAPETKRKMARTKSSGNKTNLATYTPSNKKVTVSKGTKKSIA